MPCLLRASIEMPDATKGTTLDAFTVFCLVAMTPMPQNVQVLDLSKDKQLLSQSYEMNTHGCVCNLLCHNQICLLTYRLYNQCLTIP